MPVIIAELDSFSCQPGDKPGRSCPVFSISDWPRS
jgi:hypothetical protein